MQIHEMPAFGPNDSKQGCAFSPRARDGMVWRFECGGWVDEMSLMRLIAQRSVLKFECQGELVYGTWVDVVGLT
jgi:hypothetical protein